MDSTGERRVKVATVVLALVWHVLVLFILFSMTAPESQEPYRLALKPEFVEYVMRNVALGRPVNVSASTVAAQAPLSSLPLPSAAQQSTSNDEDEKKNASALVTAAQPAEESAPADDEGVERYAVKSPVSYGEQTCGDIVTVPSARVPDVEPSPSKLLASSDYDDAEKSEPPYENEAESEKASEVGTPTVPYDGDVPSVDQERAADESHESQNPSPILESRVLETGGDGYRSASAIGVGGEGGAGLGNAVRATADGEHRAGVDSTVENNDSSVGGLGVSNERSRGAFDDITDAHERDSASGVAHDNISNGFGSSSVGLPSRVYNDGNRSGESCGSGAGSSGGNACSGAGTATLSQGGATGATGGVRRYPKLADIARGYVERVRQERAETGRCAYSTRASGGYCMMRHGAACPADPGIDLAEQVYAAKLFELLDQSSQAYANKVYACKDCTMETIIEITIEQSGKIVDVSFEPPIAEKDIARALETIIRRVGLFPPIPKHFKKQRVILSIPINIRATQGFASYRFIHGLHIV